MFNWSVCRGIILFSTLSLLLAVRGEAQVDVSQLKSALLNKSVTATDTVTKPVPLGPGWSLMGKAKTMPLTRGQQYLVSGVEIKSDSLVLDLPVLLAPGFPAAGLRSGAQFVFGEGWQTKMTTEFVLKTVGLYLPDDAALAKAKADDDRVRAETAEFDRRKAETAKVDAEAAHAEQEKTEQAKEKAQDEVAAARGAKGANQFSRKPKAGKPTYEETSAWLATKFPEMGAGFYAQRREMYEFLSMTNCVLRYRQTSTLLGPDVGSHTIHTWISIPLVDANSVDDHVSDRFESTHDYLDGITIATNHKSISLESGDGASMSSDTVLIAYATDAWGRDYDRKQLVGRVITALRHAKQLCEPPPVKSTEPF